jgi:hypothetical protein
MKAEGGGMKSVKHELALVMPVPELLSAHWGRLASLGEFSVGEFVHGGVSWAVWVVSEQSPQITPTRMACGQWGLAAAAPLNPPSARPGAAGRAPSTRTERLEVALAKTIVALALDELEEHRPQQVWLKDLQQQAAARPRP